MKEFTLKRIIENDDGFFGVLIDQITPFASTAENMWLNNVINISCIPIGSYVCRRVASPKFGDTFEVMDVEGRSHILFHKGNTEDDTAGCILVAEYFGSLGGKTAVLASKQGYGEFMQRLKGIDTFVLKIEDHTRCISNNR